MARVDNLTNFLTDVADSIRAKKGTTDTIPASSFDTEISSIQSGTGTDINDYFNETPATWVLIESFSVFVPFSFLIKRIPDFELPADVTTCEGLFNTNYYPNNSLLSIGKITSNAPVTSTAEMFYGLYALQSVDLSAFDTSNVTDMHSMFTKCNALESLNLSNFNTSKVTNMSAMFEQCSTLTTLNLSSFNTANVTNVSNMFSLCTSLSNLDISNFDFSKITMYDNMFGEYSQDGSYRIPANCYILVKDASAKEWLTSKFNWLTNVHYVDEA